MLKVWSQLNRLTHEFWGSEKSSVAISWGSVEYELRRRPLVPERDGHVVLLAEVGVEPPEVVVAVAQDGVGYRGRHRGSC